MSTPPTNPSATGTRLQATGIEDALNRRPDDPARYRRCEVCHEMGADVVTRMFVTNSGGAHTSYAHRGCAGVAGASEVLDGGALEPAPLAAPARATTEDCRVGLHAEVITP
ncbi:MULTISPECIES: hypothetical protein [unclassified Streptomyces]|uniref:Uncharacterized protein n=1 Tax=Streptomyces sp. NBC_00060 TaxID=2975636 RepID=A0AAU2HFZ3_9ACTN